MNLLELKATSHNYHEILERRNPDASTSSKKVEPYRENGDNFSSTKSGAAELKAKAVVRGTKAFGIVLELARAGDRHVQRYG